MAADELDFRAMRRVCSRLGSEPALRKVEVVAHVGERRDGLVETEVSASTLASEGKMLYVAFMRKESVNYQTPRRPKE